MSCFTFNIHVPGTNCPVLRPHTVTVPVASNFTLQHLFEQVRQLDRRYAGLEDSADVFLTPPLTRTEPFTHSKIPQIVTNLRGTLQVDYPPHNSHNSSVKREISHRYIHCSDKDYLEKTAGDFAAGTMLDCYILPKNAGDSPSVPQKRKAKAEEDSPPISVKRKLIVKDYAYDPANGAPKLSIHDKIIMSGETQKEVHEVIMALSEAIKKNTPSIDVLSDPQQGTPIIFPSASLASMPRGALIVRIKGHHGVLSRGRNDIARMSSTIERLYESENPYLSPQYRLFSTYGAGVNRLLLSTAVSLLSRGYPVVFLQLSSFNFTHQGYIFRDAILMALAAQKHYLETWENELFNACRKGREALHKFCNRLAENKVKLIFILLDFDTLSDTEQDELFSIVHGHVCCFTANPNSHYFSETSSGEIQVEYKTGGLSTNEFDGWWLQYVTEARSVGVQLTDENKMSVLEVTGAVPSLLEKVFYRIKEEKKFEDDFMDDPEYILWQLECQMPLQKSIKFEEVVIAAITNSSELLNEPLCTNTSYDSPDRRFMYLEDGYWTTPCPLSRRALEIYSDTRKAIKHRNHTNRLDGVNLDHSLDLDRLLMMIKLVKNKPLQLEFAVGRALLREIIKDGLMLKTASSQNMLKIEGALKPSFVGKGDSPRLIMYFGTSWMLIPKELNHRYINFTIIKFLKTTKKVLICPVQITILDAKSKHADSCRKFFRPGGDWEIYKEAVTLPGVGWELDWHFLWVLRPQQKMLDAKMDELVGGTGIPNYKEWEADFQMVGAKTGEALLS